MNTNATIKPARKVYNEKFPCNKFKTQTQVKTQSQVSPNTKIYFFKYDGKSSTDITCLPKIDNDTDIDNKTGYMEVNGNIWIRLSYENIVLFGSQLQKQSYHNFRVEYINKLIENSCNDVDNCNYEIIGSDSPVSDRDITIYKLLGQVSSYSLDDVKQKIQDEHYNTFMDSLEYLFDCNIYLTVFFFYSKTQPTKLDDSPYIYINPVQKINSNIKHYLCIPNTKGTYDTKKQREFAFMKLIKVLSQKEFYICKKYIEKYFPQYLTFISAMSNSRKLFLSQSVSRMGNEKTSQYYRNVGETSDNLLKTASNDKIDKLVQRMSKLSITERDTYNSIGAAFSHVVNHDTYPGIIEYITVPMYIDAAIENLGFIGQLVKKKSACLDDTFIIIKMVKYLDRICGNIKNIFRKKGLVNPQILSLPECKCGVFDKFEQQITSTMKTPLFKCISTCSATINQNRKNMVSIEVNKNKVNELICYLEQYYNNLRKNTDTPFEDKDILFKIFTLISVFTFSYISKFDEDNMNKLAIGGKLKMQPNKKSSRSSKKLK